MMTTVMKSDEARNRWRDMMDIALTGGEVVIERYNKPQAILIGHERWKEMKRRLQMLEDWAEARRIVDEIATGKTQTVSWEEIERLAEAKYGMDS